MALVLVAVTVIALVSGGVAQAQSTGPAPTPPGVQPVQVGLGIVVGAPVGEFGREVTGGAGGLTGSVGVRVRRSPVSVGGEVAYLWYGEETRKEPLSTTIPDVVVDVTTTNAMVLGLARLRVQPVEGRWRPYVDGLGGVNYLATTTGIEGTRNCSSASCETGLSSTNLSDVTGVVGAGGGVMYGFGRSRQVHLDIGLRYLRGGTATYLTQGAIRREQGAAILSPLRSRTDMVTVSVGVTFGG